MKKLLFIVLIILLIGGYMIKTTHDFNLSEKEGKEGFAKEYFKWIFQIGKSTKNVVTYAVHQDWKPVNETNKTIIEID